MSFEPYQFQMAYRLERMTRPERLECEEQAGRMAQGMWSLGRAIRRLARPEPRRRRLTMQPRRSL